jgi:hypothetical protein
VRARGLLGGASLALLLAAAVACDDAKKPTFLPEASPTALSREAELESFREFAGLIDEAVRGGDGNLFERQALSEVDMWSGDAGVLGRPPSEARESLERLVSDALPEQTDEFGSGEARLFALARSSEPRGGENRYWAILGANRPTSYQPGQYRSVVAYEFVLRAGQWRLPAVLHDPDAGPFAAAWLRGECGDVCFDHWERWEEPS